MGILKLFLIFLISVSIFSRSIVASENENLDAGIALSTQTSATVNNPAVLGAFDQTSFGLFFDPDTVLDQNFETSLAWGGRNFGLGVQYNKTEINSTFYAGLGVGLGKTHFGLNMAFLSSGVNPIDIGIRTGDRFAFALVLRDINTLRQFDIGLAFGKGSRVRFEIDAFFVGTDSIVDISTVTGNMALVVVPVKEFSLGVRTDYRLSPDFSVTELLSLDAGYWLAKNFEVYVIGVGTGGLSGGIRVRF